MRDHNSAKADVLQQALEKIGRGASLDEVLRESPAPEELRPLLLSAFRLREMAGSIEIPSPAESLNAFLQQGAAMRRQMAEAPAKKSRVWLFPWPFPQVGNLMAVAGLVLILLFGAGLTAVSQSSLPGDALFPVKQFSESVALSLPSNPAGRQNLRDFYRQRRLEETKLLLQARRAEAVEFEGQVESLQGSRLVISGLSAELSADSQVMGRLGAGATVRAGGQTTSAGDLLLSRLQVLAEGPQPTPAPSPLPIPSKTPIPPTITPEPAKETPTTEKTASSKDKDIIAPSATMTPTATPEMTIEPTPTELPVPPTDQLPSETGRNDAGGNQVETGNSHSSEASSRGSSGDGEKEISGDGHSGEGDHSGSD